MTRAPRILFSNAFYHVMNRGAARRAIFRDDSQRNLFLDLLRISSDKFEMQIHAYCLMGNHFHLLIRTLKANLSEAMHWISNQFARRVNISERLDGPIFRGRFRAIVVDADDYLVNVSRYIHLNPVTARLCVQPEDYAWSSCSGYLDEKKRPLWLHVNEVLVRVGQVNAVQAYASIVKNPLLPSLDDFYKPGRSGSFLGSNQYRRNLLNTIDASHRVLARIKERSNAINVNTLIEAVSKHFKIPAAEIISGGQGRSNIGRICAMYFAKKLCALTHTEIAAQFDISLSAVSVGLKRFEERRLKGQDLRSAMSKIEDDLKQKASTG